MDTLVLGGMYRSVIPDSVVVKDASTGKVYVRDVDYKLNAEWGQVLNLNSRLGAPGTGSIRIEYRAVIQRLDLVQVRPDGTLSVKQGVASAAEPVLPAPDAGAVALAGVHVTTLDGARASGFQVLDRDIHIVRPEVGPAAPINPGALPNTLATLRGGGRLNVTFFGDSITEGAEAGRWWEDRSKTYTSLVLNGLRQRFPTADVQVATSAAVGGQSVAAGESAFQQKVLAPHAAGQRTDLLVIALGMNDKGLPNTDGFKQQLAGYVSRARAVGMEVLLVTPMDSNPHYAPWFATYAPRGQIAQAIRDVAAAGGVAAADVYADWVNQSARGVAPVSQLHNWFNHPGERGMRLYADTILRLLPAGNPGDPVPPPPPPGAGPAADLMNSVTDTLIGRLSDGYVIDMGQVGTKLNIRATPAGPAGSIVFKLDGVVVRTETTAPYAIGGDAGGTDFLDWTPPTGTHALEILQYSQPQGTGTVVASTVLSFTVVAPSSPPTVPPPVANGPIAELFNSATDTKIATLTDGYVIDLARTGTRLNIQGLPLGTAGSLRFLIDGQEIKTESYAPYTIGGDNGNDFLDWTPPTGTHTLQVVQFSGVGGSGFVQGTTTLLISVLPPSIG